MKEELISFETAKLAKEKGFDVETDRYFDEDGGMWTFNNWGDGLRDGAYWRPTQSLLQKWLRDIHNIDVQPYLIRLEHNGVELEQSLEEKEYEYQIIVKGNTLHYYTVNESLSYEEALEKGLQEALKLIK